VNVTRWIFWLVSKIRAKDFGFLLHQDTDPASGFEFGCQSPANALKSVLER
jgi:hypothetical protein